MKNTQCSIKKNINNDINNINNNKYEEYSMLDKNEIVERNPI